MSLQARVTTLPARVLTDRFYWRVTLPIILGRSPRQAPTLRLHQVTLTLTLTLTGANTPLAPGLAPPQGNVPPEYACALTGKIMEEPVQTPYGEHRFEASALRSHVCNPNSLALALLVAQL